MRFSLALWPLKTYSAASMCFLTMLSIMSGLSACSLAGGAVTPITISVRDNYFDPNAVTSTPGKVVSLTFHNAGAVSHIVQIVGLTEQKVIQAGQTATFTVTPQTRQYAIVDALYGADGMIGTLIGGAPDQQASSPTVSPSVAVQGTGAAYKTYLLDQADQLLTLRRGRGPPGSRTTHRATPHVGVRRRYPRLLHRLAQLQDVERGIVVPMQAGSALWAAMPANGQALRDDNATARTGLTGERRVYRLHSLPGARSLESKDGEKLSPARIADALGQMVIPHQVGNPQVFMVDDIVGVDELVGLLVVEVTPLPCDMEMRLGQQGDGFAPTMTALLAPGDPSLAAA